MCPASISYRECPNAHVVKLQSGFGNQLFQYAFGQGLAAKTGMPVLYEAGMIGPHRYRDYELGIFKNIDIEIVDFRSIGKIGHISSPGYDGYSENVYVTEPTFFDGHWQNEKNFQFIENDIRQALTFPSLLDFGDEVKQKLYQIEECGSPVGVHVRRGDYVQKGWSLRPSYYHEAMEIMRSSIKNPKFFIFGADDDEWMCDVFGGYDDVEFMGYTPGNGRSWIDMALFGRCKHAIIPNSTFAWWAAWLGLPNNGIVIAPSPWLYRRDAIVCSNWRKLKV